ncbi:MAG: bifunctional DNA-binding transcriptional regulator/O6-methylguanine-DNA methyltransferase Ada [Ancalomicrobiaceae bacterium]|nr:bifunctional DNA-binding transcriptional regulator/O6-methylguanine-DNA methyltransferase Ada [Ancalomicrobiaceae bacterium]
MTDATMERRLTRTSGADEAAAIITADPRWALVAARDATADGSFVYAVRTTGVYCRPSCRSRPAKPENVCFFASPVEAETDGYRACRRCRPNDAGAAHTHAALVADACRAIETAEEPPGLAALADRASLSPFHFQRVFKAVTGLSPKAYATAHRAVRLRDRLSGGETSVTAAIYDAGFNSSSRAYETADEALGMTPSAFRSGGKDVAIRYAYGQSSLGLVLIASTDRGICAILLGDDPIELLRDLEARFPLADLLAADADTAARVAEVVAFVEHPSTGLDLPLDLRGTAFQLRVWQALRRIPAGTTVSYSDLARTIGDPSAVRAVAGACAANKLAVAVPCHRVVRSDGALSGYRWGLERKRELLKRERQG